MLLRKDPLAAPFTSSAGILALQGIGHPDPTPAVGQVVPVDLPDPPKMLLKRRLQGCRKHGDAVSASLAVANDDLVISKANVLHTQ